MKGNKRIFTIFVVLVALVLSLYYFKMSSGTFSGEVLEDFAIEDTLSIDRVEISDYMGKSIVLTKNPEDRLWRVNDEYYAKEYSVHILMKTFSDIEVKARVPEARREHVIKSIASRGTKVAIYSNGELNKTYLVGSCAQDQKGTYMVLEHGDGTRSSEPLLMFMKKFTGCLKQRFFTKEEEWRYTGIFDYPEMEFNRVDFTHTENPEFSYSITYDGGNDIKLFDGQGQEMPNMDTLLVKDYLLLFKKVHMETYDSYLSEFSEDSLLQTVPAFTFQVTENSGKKKKIDLYLKKPVMDYYLPDGDIAPWDMERMFGKVEGEEVGLVQTYVFNPLLKELPYFLKQE